MSTQGITPDKLVAFIERIRTHKNAPKPFKMIVPQTAADYLVQNQGYSYDHFVISNPIKQ